MATINISAIRKQTANRTIYVETSSGFFVRVSKKHFTEMLNNMKVEGAPHEGIHIYGGTPDTCHVMFPKVLAS
jgi:hypothetical protein